MYSMNIQVKKTQTNFSVDNVQCWLYKTVQYM